MSGRVNYLETQEASQKSMEILKVLTSVCFLNPTLTAKSKQINYKVQQMVVSISSIVLSQPNSSQILLFISIP